MNITRFDQDMDGSMGPSESGRWVRYDDVKTALAELLAVVTMVANIGEYRHLVNAMAEVLNPNEREAFIEMLRVSARAAIVDGMQS